MGLRAPLFLIWAPNSGNVEIMNPVDDELARGSKQISAMPDAGHVRGIHAQPREYERRVTEFFDDALLRSR